MSVAARCQNAIDYTKPVNGLVESLIFNRIETLDEIRLASIGETIELSGDGTDSTSSFPTTTYKENLSDNLFPWTVGQRNNVNTGFMSTVQEYKQLFGLNKE